MAFSASYLAYERYKSRHCSTFRDLQCRGSRTRPQGSERVNCHSAYSQLLLSNLVFSQAEYYSQLFMLKNNLSLRYLASSPITFALIALLIRYCEAIKGLVSYGAKANKSVVFAMAAYTITLCLIARPDEYGLFLPFLPLILWVFEDYRQKRVSI